MDSKKLHQLILNPQEISESDFSELQDLIQNYPYFQAAYSLFAKVSPSKENVRKAAIRTSHRGVLKNLIMEDKGATQEWVSNNMPDFHPEEDINAFEKLSEDQESELNLSATSEESLLQTDSSVDFEVDDSPIFKEEENSVEAPAVTTSYEENENQEFKEVEYEHPAYEHDEVKNDDKNIPAEENPIEEVDISDFEDYKDPSEDTRNELLETLASFEKNKVNIDEVHQYDIKKTEPELKDSSAENLTDVNNNEDKSSIEEDSFDEESKSIDLEDEPDEFFAINEEISEEEKPTEPQSPEEKEDEDVVIDDSYFDLNNYLDDEIEKPDKKKSLVKKLRYTDTHQKQSIIIDSFVNNMPAMPAPNTEHVPENKTDLSTESVTENDNLITEQLALIYQKQQKTNKAIHIYEKLMLKYPNKKTYFALQIEKLKKDI